MAENVMKTAFPNPNSERLKQDRLTYCEEYDRPEVDVEHEVMGFGAVLASHFVLRGSRETVQGQRQQLTHRRKETNKIWAFTLSIENTFDTKYQYIFLD